MRNHWPLIIAALLIGTAVGYGLYQRQQIEEAALVTPLIKPLPAVYIATPNGESPARTVSMTPAATTVGGFDSRTRTDVLPPLNNPAMNGRPLPAQPQPTTQTLAQNNAAGAGTTLAPQTPIVFAPNAQMPPIAPGTARGIAFTNLRAGLIQKFGVVPMPTQTGGFAIAADGVRIEADTGAEWSLILYNNNPANPTVQSENFKAALNLVIANFGLDMTAQPYVSADGKQSLRTQSNTGGRVTMVTDPAMGNSVTIKPLQKRPIVQPGAQPAPGTPVPQPQLVQPTPAQPVPQVGRGNKANPPKIPIDPVAPPKPPNNEQF